MEASGLRKRPLASEECLTAEKRLDQGSENARGTARVRPRNLFEFGLADGSAVGLPNSVGEQRCHGVFIELLFSQIELHSTGAAAEFVRTFPICCPGDRRHGGVAGALAHRGNAVHTDIRSRGRF